MTSLGNEAEFDALWAECTAHKRLVPMPPQWSQLYKLLKNTRRGHSGGWEPPLPLILAAWHYSMPIENNCVSRSIWSGPGSTTS